MSAIIQDPGIDAGLVETFMGDVRLQGYHSDDGKVWTKTMNGGTDYVREIIVLSLQTQRKIVLLQRVSM